MVSIVSDSCTEQAFGGGRDLVKCQGGRSKRQRVEATKGEEVDLDEMQDEGLDEMGEVVEEKKEEENCVNVSIVVV